jgi:hypothetical protein
MLDARSLLAEADARYDARAERDARASGWRGFDGGLAWMARRSGTVPAGSGAVLGLLKYGACALVAAIAALVVVALGDRSLVSFAPASLAALFAFYALESRWVFVFPAAAHGERRPFAVSRALVRRHGGTLAAMRVVLPIAASMVFGGFAGRGFLRSWCVGCLAVLVWYERLARTSPR